MKKLQTLFALIACLSFFGCGNDLNADSSLVPAIEVPGASAKPMAYAKIIALPKLIQKAVEVVNAVKPGPESAMLPMVVGLALGDASLSSVDPDAPVTVFIFDDFKKGEPTFVLAMNLESDSPIKKQAETVGLKTIEEDGWTLATMSPDLFDEVTDWSSILSFAEKDLEEDLEAGVLLDTFWNELPTIKDSITQELGSSGMDSMLHLFLDEVANLEATKIELSLSAEEIMMRATVSAKEETELHALFSSQPSSPDPEILKYVPSGGWMDLVVNLDSASFLKYFEQIVGLVEEKSENTELKEMLASYLSLIRDSIKLYDGQVAMSYRVSEDGNPMDLVGVANTQASASELRELVKKSTGFTQKLSADSELLGSTGLKYDFEFEDVEPIDGIDVLRFGMDMEGEGPLGQQLEASPFSNVNMHFAIYEGKYLSATKREELAKILKAIKADQPLENNLAGQITLTKGDALAWRLDVVSYARMVMSMVSLGGENPLREMMDGLLELKIPPVTGKVSLGKGRLSSEMRIPVKSIKAGFDYFESATQSAFEGPGDFELEEPSIGLPEATDFEREE
jgi:hypothetical protein